MARKNTVTAETKETAVLKNKDNSQVVTAETKETAVPKENTEAKMDTSVNAEVKLSPMVEKAMQLYPNLESMWITPQGFVHPKDVPEYLRKGATLYTNKYYNK